jgi:hypothetical protein
MTQRKSRFQQELSIIPLGWTIAAAVSIVVIEVLFEFFIPEWTHHQGLPPRPWLDLMGAAGALMMAATLLLTGYIYADAKRRRMNAVLWTLLVLLTPKPIGFIAYFLLRSPLVESCPKCGAAVGADFAYCSKCSGALLPACPGCGRPIRRDFVCCPYCGKTATQVAT